MTQSIRNLNLALGVGLCLALAGLGSAQTGSKMEAAHKPGVSASDLKFMKSAAQGGIAEVRLGELATKNGSSDSVKQFGERMVDDHSKANEDLKQVASNKGVTLPTDTDAKHKAVMAKLEKLHGAAFDATYVKDMKADHQHDVAEFSKEASSASDPEVKAFAARTLPVIKEHCQMISSISKNRSKSMHAHASSGSKM